MPTPVPPSDYSIRKALGDFSIEISDEQLGQIREYIRLLLTWNEKINLTAIRDPLDILYRHFCESMFASRVAALNNCRLADIGTGGGFPGLPLKILLPDLELFLVESNVKKATFLAEVVRSLGLHGARVIVGRYEELGEEVSPLDAVLARALGEFGPLLQWAGSQAVDAKRVILWLGLQDAEAVVKIDGWNWSEPVEVPKSLRRVILVGSRASAGPA
jgi:16S rRNA (guanine(527)-N(7))-methyltransferase RsmG